MKSFLIATALTMALFVNASAQHDHKKGAAMNCCATAKAKCCSGKTKCCTSKDCCCGKKAACCKDPNKCADPKSGCCTKCCKAK